MARVGQVLRSKWLLVGWAGWGGLVLLYYYRQITGQWALGPLGVLLPQFSLQVAVGDFLSVGASVWAFATGSLPARYPALAEAAQRAGAGLLGMLLVTLAAWFAGRVALRLLRYRPADRLEASIFHLATGFGVLAYLFLLLAGLGLYRPVFVAGLTLLLAALELVRRRLPMLQHALDGDAPAGQQEARLVNRADLPWVAVVVLAGGVALITALAPETEFDALLYHLYLPRLWLAAGMPVDLVTERTSLYPLTWELLFGAGLVFGGSVAAKLLQTVCFGLVIAASVAWLRAERAAASPWLAAALFACTPTVLWAATTAYVDIAVTLHLFLACFALWRFLETRRSPVLWLAAIQLGLALATKHTALLALPIIAPGLLLLVWRRGRDLRQAVTTTALLTAVALLISLPWYWRAWQASGNPVFPSMYAVFGAFPPERWNAATEQGLVTFLARFGRPWTVPNYVTVPWDLTMHAARYGGTLGPLFLALLPGLLWVRRSLTVGLAGAFALGYLTLWATPLSSEQMRFLLPIVPFLALLIALAFAALLARTGGRVGRWLLTALLAVLLLLQLPPFTSLHEGDRQGVEGWLSHVIYSVPWRVVSGHQPMQEYMQWRVPSYPVWQYANAQLPPEANILTFSDGDHFYSDRARLWSDSAVAWPATWGARVGEEEAVLQTLCDLRVTHVLVDRSLAARVAPSELPIVQPAFVGPYLEPLYEDSHFTLYRLKADCS